MKLHQLRTFQQIVANGLSLTRAAEALHATQPGLSRHIQSLEHELGTDLFVRERSRLTRLTPSGAALLPATTRILDAVDDFHRIARECAAREPDTITIAASPTHARYTLPPVVGRFLRDYPNVRLRLREGRSARSLAWLASGEADFSISSIPAEAPDGLMFLPCGQLHWTVLTLPDHPLLALSRVRLADIARFPVITYESDYSSRAAINRAFAQERLEPDIVMSAGNVDAMKKYVQCGLGIAIVARSEHDHDEDSALAAIDIRHLIPSGRVHIGVRQPGFLSKAAVRLIAMLAPDALSMLRPPAPD
jgi:LysR family transcriptional regulator, cys regulon transcriptional activator